MKRTLCSLCIGSVMLALTAAGAPPDKTKGKGRGKASAEVTAPAKGRTTVKSGGKARAQYSVARPHARSKTTDRHASVQPDRGRTTRNANVASKSKVRKGSDVVTKSNSRASRDVASRSKVRANRNVAGNRERAFRGGGDQVRSRGEVAAAQKRSFRADRTGRFDRSRNVAIVNSWRDSRFSGGNYAAFRDYRRVYHDRAWYTNNYSRIIFVMGGYWYWNSGYWYPAWGYAPYAYYPYDGPIYTGYADLTPDQVVVNVQIQLQRDGYYFGSIDGLLGPQTRRALAAFQADHGLAITSAIDEPTIATLGLT
jgi:Putative peptidoglycan binding domain